MEAPSHSPSPHPHLGCLLLLGIISMSQNVLVPKFGNWERDNIPYTTCFENARSEKGAGLKIFNPNDPEENPDAFMPVHRKQQTDNASDHGTVNAFFPSPNTNTRSVKKHHQRIHSSEEPAFQGFMGTPARSPAAKQITLHPQKRVNHADTNSETSNGKSSSDRSVPPIYHRCRSCKDSTHSSYGFSPSPSRHHGYSPSPSQKYLSRHTGNTGQGEYMHRRVPSVPKFGDWDETDPKSAEGFTFIFNKVKEEKISAGHFPVVPPEALNYRAKQKSGRYASSRSKILCCLYPAADG